MKAINIGIDLDETLINNYEDRTGYSYIKWDIKPCAAKYLPLLYKMGFNFHLITARQFSEKNNVNSIIQYIENKLNVKFQSITLTNGSPKGFYARQKNCFCMIDDNTDFLYDCSKHNVLPILFGNNNNPPKNYTFCPSWHYVYNYLLQLLQ